jgi:isochorismate synthase
LLIKLHPTPAVCGIPKENAKEMIREFEKHRRGDYTGYFGPVKTGDVSLFVNLRSAFVNNNKMFLFIGGGITADSKPEKEWDETELKAKTLLNCYKNC